MWQSESTENLFCSTSHFMMVLAHTRKLQGLLKIVEHKFWEYREPLIMLEEPHLGCWVVTLRLVSVSWRLAVSSCGFGLSMELK